MCKNRFSVNAFVKVARKFHKKLTNKEIFLNSILTNQYTSTNKTLQNHFQNLSPFQNASEHFKVNFFLINLFSRFYGHVNLNSCKFTISRHSFLFPMLHPADIHHLLYVGVWQVGGFCQQLVPFSASLYQEGILRPLIHSVR